MPRRLRGLHREPRHLRERHGGSCSGPLCGSIPNCGDDPILLTGRVTSPNGALNVPNAIVYIPRDPNAQLPAISTGPSCERCEDEDLGPVLAAATTDHEGKFTLKSNVPANAAFNIVVKSGKWRGVRQIGSGVVTGCGGTDIGDTYTRLPAHKADGLAGTHLPHIAIATGDADAMECVFYKMGIAGSEFTTRNGSGSIHLYRANGARVRNLAPNPKPCGGGTIFNDCAADRCQPSESACHACDGAIVPCTWTPNIVVDESVSATELTSRFDDYDMVVWDCEGDERNRSADHTSLRNFVNAGGRFFASHWSSDWIKDNPGLTDVSTWDSGSASSGTGHLSFGRPRGNTSRLRTFARWLHNEGAATITFTGGEPTAGSFTIQDPRDNARTVGSDAEEWVYRTISGGTSAQTFSFNTPVGATGDAICGRVTYSGFHVAEGFGSGGAGSQDFPNHCSGALTNQEKVLAYMLFDLAACVSEGDPPEPPSCQALTEAEACEGKDCGVVSDGCGDVHDCGDCPEGEYCSGSNICVSPTCIALDCSDIGASCGKHADGCGGFLDCGTCTLPETCGGGGIPNQCGHPCKKLTCEDLDANCGKHGDGCGGILDCGTCTAPETCGGGGVPNQCGTVGCTKATCESLGFSCGKHGDGCGGTLECGSCEAPETCGGGGIPNQCGHPTCQPLSCDDQGIECGPACDGCGGQHASCGECTWPETCGGGGIPGRCGVADGGFCEPSNCEDLGIECGPAGDGCGGLLECGSCEAPDTCGGAGVPGQCGHTACVPKTCEELGIECGPAGDGCGGELECGSCEEPETCGGGGVPGQCGKPDCEPRTCKELDIDCGHVGDGCGGLLECGTCAPPLTCGGGGVPGKCGGVR